MASARGSNANEKNRQMYFVANKLNLPIFVMGRNRMKYHNLEPVRNYITSKRLGYTSTCNEENATETATTKKLKNICGFYGPSRSNPCPIPRVLNNTRDLIRAQSWQLPPNRYNYLMVPFNRLKGAGGAYWKKLHEQRPLPQIKGSKPQWKFYELSRDTERMQKPCNRHKGIFLTNARDRRATSRCMVSSNLTCYHNPKHPGPTTYYPKNLIKFAEKKKVKPPNPYIFYRNSCVPVRETSLYPKNISFLPGPGRYENRFIKLCPCFGTYKGKKLIYQPDLYVMVERQKILKFRRQHYVKINAKQYCSPDWAHVQGHGHSRLFKNATPKPKFKTIATKEAKKGDLKLFPDARYIGMINDPPHQVISHRMEPLRMRPVRIYYNCLSKRVVRRTLHINKKIAFNSGQERFKDAERPTVLTVTQQEEKKSLLPIERQLRDYPITRHPLSDIKGKLHETPTHMKPAFELELRKRNFKFLPLPSAKILVTETDLRPKKDETIEAQQYFGRNLNVLDFLKESILPKELEEIKEFKELKRI